ncbi:outer membrane protein [Pelagicoccus mobilis]|uniref:Outer membrane beta-barrel protein n=1 Tax=Pelagicoccus mobilis TaxID=415221 RepID=A0A934VPI1_9BACT|nr:outer membrane beta-barrel protein [Pelagicoccus mobilis]MBK1877312.1 outer membrane beta-barrel protein [Pelagicoccus mobilis]
MKQTAGTLAVVFLALSTSATAIASKVWEHSLELYGLGINIDGSTSVGRAVGNDLDVDFEKIRDNLEFGGMIHFESFNTQENWGVFFDYSFMNLGKGRPGAIGVTEIDVDQAVLEGFFTKRINGKKSRTDLLLGLRWWDNDLELTIDPNLLDSDFTTKVNEDWIDLVVGVRTFIDLDDKWTLALRGDIGGMGLESDFTFQGMAGFQYKLSEHWSLDFQYIAIWVDYETGEIGRPGYYEYDTVSHGPLLGIIRKF